MWNTDNINIPYRINDNPTFVLSAVKRITIYYIKINQKFKCQDSDLNLNLLYIIMQMVEIIEE
jgi:hypothetical protein